MSPLPFKLLGGILGSEEPLDSVEFEAGEFELRPPEQEKLTLLSTALIERPQLNLLIPQGFNRAADQLALQEKQLDRQIEEQVLQVTNEGLSTLDKRVAALEALAGSYQPAIDPQLDQLAYSNELEQYLLGSAQSITELELEALANNRATEIQAYLVESEPSIMERIIISPEVIEQNDGSDSLIFLLSLTGT